jgi:hypothetical protein
VGYSSVVFFAQSSFSAVAMVESELNRLRLLADQASAILNEFTHMIERLDEMSTMFVIFVRSLDELFKEAEKKRE